MERRGRRALLFIVDLGRRRGGGKFADGIIAGALVTAGP
jgi:hypothetical protein